GMRPMIESAVTDFPQPHSPTMPSVFPFSSEKLMPSTACTTPSRVKKWVLRSLTSRTAKLGLPRARIECVAEAVGDEVRAQNEGGDREARDEEHLRMEPERLSTVLGDRPPGSGRRVDAEADEGEERLAEDDARELEEDRDHEDAERVRQNVPRKHPVPARAHRLGGTDVVVLLQRDHLAADDASGGEPARDRQRDDHRPHAHGARGAQDLRRDDRE